MLVTIPGNGSKPISGLNNDILMALTVVDVKEGKD